MAKEFLQFHSGDKETKPRGDFRVDGNRVYTQEALKVAIEPVLGRFLEDGGNKILEIGCGNGFFARMVASLDPERLVCLDRDQGALNRLHSLAPEFKLLQADARNLPFPDSSVGAILGLSVYRIFYYEDAFQEAQRVLRAGGKLLLFQDFGFYSKAMELDLGRIGVDKVHQRLIENARKTGFEILDGYSSVVGTAVENLDKLWESLPEEERIRLSNGIARTGGGNLLGFARAHGDVVSFSAPQGRERIILRRMERLLDVDLPRVEFVPGEQYAEFVRVRYLVLEKT